MKEALWLKVSDSIRAAKERHKRSSELRKERQINRPVSVSGLCRFFNHQFEKAGFGAPPLLTKDTTNKLNGFLKVLKNNDYSDRDIYGLVKNYINAFERIKSEEFFTANNKKYVLGGRPTLKDLIICRDCIINKVMVEDIPDIPDNGSLGVGNIDVAAEIEDLDDE